MSLALFLTYSSILTNVASKYSHNIYYYKEKSMAIIKKIVQQLSKTITPAIETTPLLYQFISICFFIGRFSNSVLHCNLNWWRSRWAVHKFFSLKNMYEQSTGGKIAIANECNIK